MSSLSLLVNFALGPRADWRAHDHDENWQDRSPVTGAIWYWLREHPGAYAGEVRRAFPEIPNILSRLQQLRIARRVRAEPIYTAAGKLRCYRHYAK